MSDFKVAASDWNESYTPARRLSSLRKVALGNYADGAPISAVSPPVYEKTTDGEPLVKLGDLQALDNDDVQLARALHTLAALELDVAGRVGAGDPGQRVGDVEARQVLGQ